MIADDTNTAYPDATVENADWTKKTWDLPPYKSPAFLALFPDLAAFRALPVYRHAVAADLIPNVEWNPSVIAPTPLPNKETP